MTKITKTLITAATLAAALAGGVAQAASVQDSTFTGDKYGYTFRTGKFDTFTEGARTGKFDPFTEGARIGKFDPYTDGARVGKADPYTDGARTVAGLDRSGVSAQPSRSFDPYTDGARVGKADPYTDGAIA
ncbi:conserved exported hypothetical protein [Cupriavidus necator]|uniref:Copper resistance protein CopQ n=1 Tax=Cupriavidus necator TaxID=106590 RepID=A0A1K0JI79_CUPNE|nr:conserved exported hypothetical protein [Cupriavidus necator]